MFIHRLFNFQRMLRTGLLAWLLWAALFPAHFANVGGRVVELCTNQGVSLVWLQDDSSNANSSASMAANSNPDAPSDASHGQPHCAWCIFSLPALIFLAMLCVGAPNARRFAKIPYLNPLYTLTSLWCWGCPRAPPQFTPIFV